MIIITIKNMSGLEQSQSEFNRTLANPSSSYICTTLVANQQSPFFFISFRLLVQRRVYALIWHSFPYMDRGRGSRTGLRAGDTFPKL